METQEHCSTCGELTYGEADKISHGMVFHNVGPVGTVWPQAEPETRKDA
jgi:hypothetical protein